MTKKRLQLLVGLGWILFMAFGLRLYFLVIDPYSKYAIIAPDDAGTVALVGTVICGIFIGIFLFAYLCSED